MNMNFRSWLSVLGGLALAIVVNEAAGAQCGLPQRSIKPTSSIWRASDARLRSAAFEQESEHADRKPTIVGMWHVTFTAKTNNGAAIPNTVIDNSLVVWHSDQTEIMNSGRPAQDGNFCLGVWAETSPLEYKLNHFAWAGNNYTPGSPEGLVGPPTGPVHYVENVRLAADGQHYSGTFTLKAYDTSGNVFLTFTGAIKATRVTVDTTTADLL